MYSSFTREINKIEFDQFHSIISAFVLNVNICTSLILDQKLSLSPQSKQDNFILISSLQCAYILRSTAFLCFPFVFPAYAKQGLFHENSPISAKKHHPFYIVSLLMFLSK
jgi:hypothetical protein